MKMGCANRSRAAGVAGVLACMSLSVSPAAFSQADPEPYDETLFLEDNDDLAAKSEERGAVPHKRVIEEIVVTATKRSESLRDIPQSISATSGESLEARGVLSMDEFLQETPGLLTNSTAVGEKRITLRGLETSVEAFTPLASTTGILVGDVSFNDPSIGPIVPDFSTFDLKSVEVLKGPQGTLFGGTALAGAIRYQMADADPEAFALKAFSSYEAVDQGSRALSTGVAVNVPLGRDAAFRVTALRKKYPGWIDDYRVEKPDIVVDANQGDGDQLRLRGLWEPDDHWRFDLTHLSEEYQAPYGLHTSSDDRGGPPVSGERLVPAFLDQAYGLQSLEVGWTGDAIRVVGLVSTNDKRRSMVIDGTASEAQPPDDNTPEESALFILINQDTGAQAQELRLQSIGTGPLQWLLGVYNYDYETKIRLVFDSVGNQQLNGPDSPGGAQPRTYLLTTALDSTVYEQAVFGDIKYAPWDKWEFGLGARLYRTNVAGDVRHAGLVSTVIIGSSIIGGEPVAIDPETAAARIQADISESGVNPRLSATWFARDWWSTYFAAARGFRLGGVQSAPPNDEVPATYNSDSLWNYELGLRSDWLDSTLRIDATLFYVDWQSPIVNLRTDGPPSGSYFDNAGAAVSQGFDMALQWLPPVDGLMISAALGYTDAHVTEPFVAPGGEEIQPGTQLPGNAKWQGNAAVAWNKNWRGIDFGATASATYVGRGYVDLAHYFPINDYTMFTAGVSATFLNWPGLPTLSINGTNLSNVITPIQKRAYSAGDPDADGYDINTKPRSVIMRLSVEF